MRLRFEHLIYGESPNPDYTGFQVLALSAGLDAGDEQAIKKRVNVGHALALESGIYRHDAYDLLPSGRVAFSVRVPGVLEDRDNADARRKIICHTFVTELAAFETINNPFAVFSRDNMASWSAGEGRLGLFWNSENFRDVRQVMKYSPLDIEVGEGREWWQQVESLRSTFVKRSSDVALQRSAAQVLTAWVQRRAVVLTTTADRLHEDLIRLVWMILPKHDRLRTTFSTHAVPFQHIDYAFCAVPAEYVADPKVAPQHLDPSSAMPSDCPLDASASLVAGWLATGNRESFERFLEATKSRSWHQSSDLPLRVERQTQFQQGHLRIGTPEELQKVLAWHLDSRGNVEPWVNAETLDGAIQRDLAALDVTPSDAAQDAWATAFIAATRALNPSLRSRVLKGLWAFDKPRSWVVGCLVRLWIDHRDTTAFELLSEYEPVAFQWLQKHQGDCHQFLDWAFEPSGIFASRLWAASLGVRALSASHDASAVRAVFRKASADVTFLKHLIVDIQKRISADSLEVAVQELLARVSTGPEVDALQTFEWCAPLVSRDSAFLFLRAIQARELSSPALTDKVLDIIDEQLSMSTLPTTGAEVIAGCLVKAIRQADGAVAALIAKHSQDHSAVWVLLANTAESRPGTRTFAALLDIDDSRLSNILWLRILDQAARSPLDQDASPPSHGAIETMNRVGSNLEALLLGTPAPKAMHFRFRQLLDGGLGPGLARRCQQQILADVRRGFVVSHGWASVPWARLVQTYPVFAVTLIELLATQTDHDTASRILRDSSPEILRAAFRGTLRVRNGAGPWAPYLKSLSNAYRPNPTVRRYEADLLRLYDAALRTVQRETP